MTDKTQVIDESWDAAMGRLLMEEWNSFVWGQRLPTWIDENALRLGSVRAAVEHLATEIAVPAVVRAPASVEAAPEWRCFHCGDSFTDRAAAAEHFGRSEVREPACFVDIAKYREMEAIQERYIEEDTDLHRELARLQNDHAIALRREEEKGYARGLADAAKSRGEGADVIQKSPGVRAALLAYHSRPCDPEAEAVVHAVLAEAGPLTPASAARIIQAFSPFAPISKCLKTIAADVRSPVAIAVVDHGGVTHLMSYTTIGDFRAMSAAIKDADGEAVRMKRVLKELGEVIHDLTVGMQAAWIEWQHGEGAEEAMTWIENALAGPGHIPDEDAPHGKDAQAYFDANKSHAFPVCKCGRPSNILWMGQGFCSNEHYGTMRETAVAVEGKTS